MSEQFSVGASNQPSNQQPNHTNTMSAKQLIQKLTKICNENGVNPKDVQVNFRWSDDSDVWRVKTAEEDLFDEETNNVLTSICLTPHRK